MEQLKATAPDRGGEERPVGVYEAVVGLVRLGGRDRCGRRGRAHSQRHFFTFGDGEAEIFDHAIIVFRRLAARREIVADEDRVRRVQPQRLPSRFATGAPAMHRQSHPAATA